MTQRQTISEFFGDYRFLSNFYMHEIEYEGIVYLSNEHAYQAAKTLDIEERKKIAALLTAGDAKKAGKKLKIRPDWEEVKLQVMRDCVRIKFEDDGLRRKLLLTNDAELIEGNNWNDTFWGVCDGVGTNHLGIILMETRAGIREVTEALEKIQHWKLTDEELNELIN